MPEYASPTLAPAMEGPQGKPAHGLRHVHSAANSFSSSSYSSSGHSSDQRSINHNKHNSTSSGYHRSSMSCSSIPEIPDIAEPTPRVAIMHDDGDDGEEFPLRPPPSVLPKSGNSSPLQLPASPSPSLQPIGSPSHSPVNGHSPVHVNKYQNLAPPSAHGNSIPRSASTPAVLTQQSSPYGQPQRNSSSNSLYVQQQTYRTSRLSGQPFSSRSSVSSLDFTAPGVIGGHERTMSRSHSPAPEIVGSAAFDLNQSFITNNLGANSASLMPRIKTIELYRINAKKSHDPAIQFQFAQYMLQTALLSGKTKNDANKTPPSVDSGASSLEMPRQPRRQASMQSLSSASSGSATLNEEQELKIKRDLLKEAVSHLTKLSMNGYADAQYLLGDAYASGALGKPDLKESYSMFQQAAKHGHSEAAYRAALCLEEGWGTSKDARKAVLFLRQASSKGHPGAMLRLGIACFYGKMGLHMGSSAARDLTQKEGIKWLTRAAETANETFPQGPFELAKIYETGYKDIVFKDLEYTVQLYVKSADLNYVPAASKLGSAYEYGTLGCPQDAALSIHYYTIAALGGDPTAMLAMCAWYMVGAEPMLPRNEEEAYEWASRAAQRGLAKAQYATGYFLENAIGCERDILQATEWYRRAAAGGDDRAMERLKTNMDKSLQLQGAKPRKGEGKAAGKKDGKDKDCIIM